MTWTWSTTTTTIDEYSEDNAFMNEIKVQQYILAFANQTSEK